MFTRRILGFGAIYLLWGGSFLAIRVVVQVVPPLFAASVRYSLSATILLLLNFVVERGPLPSAKQFWNCVLTGSVMFVLGYAGIYWAETRLASWLVAVLSSTGLLWTYVVECLVLRTEHLRAGTLMPLAAGVAGMALLVRPPGDAHQMGSLLATCVVLASVLSWSTMTVVLKRIDLPRSYLQTAGLQLSGATAVLFPVSLAVGEWRRLPEASRIFQAQPVLGMTYLVLGGSVLAFTSFHWLLARERPSLVATSTFVNPIVAMLAGIVLLHERHSPVQMGGAAAVLASVILVWSTKANAEPVSTIPAKLSEALHQSGKQDW